MEKRVRVICKYLENVSGITQVDEKEIIEYGIVQGIYLGVNLLIFLMVGLFFRNLSQGVMFLAAFWPLRIYVGGYHADTRRHCFFLSVCMIIIVFSVMQYIELSEITFILMSALAFVVIVRMSPIGSKNRLLDETEILMFRTRIKMIQTVEVGVFLISYFAGYGKIPMAIMCAQYLVMVLLVAGYLKNKIQHIS